MNAARRGRAAAVGFALVMATLAFVVPAPAAARLPTGYPLVTVDIGKFLDISGNPPGRPYPKTPVPPEQRNLPRAASARARPAGAPVAVDLGAIETPSGGELRRRPANRTGRRGA